MYRANVDIYLDVQAQYMVGLSGMSVALPTIYGLPGEPWKAIGYTGFRSFGYFKPFRSGWDCASKATIEGADQLLAALLLLRASDPSLKFQRM